MKSTYKIFTALSLALMVFIASYAHAETMLNLTTDNIPPAFNAQYTVKFGGIGVGKLEVSLTQDNASNWTYHSNSFANGLAAVFVGNNKVTDTSKLTLFDESIRPTHYERIRKTKEADKSERVYYQWDELAAKSTYKDREVNIELNELTTDKFTLQLLVMANINDIPDKMALPVISKAELKQYKIINSGKETINTAYGERNTIIIERVKDDSSYKIWADPDTHGLPLKVERIKQGKTEYIVVLEESSLFKDNTKMATQSRNSPQASYFQSR